MLKGLKLLFWGNLVSQSMISIFLWLCAGAAFYEINYTIHGSKEFSPVMVGTFIISFILGSYIYSKSRSTRSLEDQISMGVSRATSPAMSSLGDLIAIGFLTISIAFIIIMSFSYLIYIASVYTVYVLGVQLYKKKKLSVNN